MIPTGSLLRCSRRRTARCAADAVRIQSRAGAGARGGVGAAARADPAAMVARGGGRGAPPPRRGRTAAHRDRGRGSRSRRPAGADRCARGRGGAGVRDRSRTGAPTCSVVPAVSRSPPGVCSVRPTPRDCGRSVPPMASPVCCAAFRRTPARAAACCRGTFWPSIGLTPEGVIAAPHAAAVQAVMRQLAHEGLMLLPPPRRTAARDRRCPARRAGKARSRTGTKSHCHAVLATAWPSWSPLLLAASDWSGPVKRWPGQVLA